MPITWRTVIKSETYERTITNSNRSSYGSTYRNGNTITIEANHHSIISTHITQCNRAINQLTIDARSTSSNTDRRIRVQARTATLVTLHFPRTCFRTLNFCGAEWKILEVFSARKRPTGYCILRRSPGSYLLLAKVSIETTAAACRPHWLAGLFGAFWNDPCPIGKGAQFAVAPAALVSLYTKPATALL